MSFEWVQRILARIFPHLSQLLPLVKVVPRLPGQTPVSGLSEVAMCRLHVAEPHLAVALAASTSGPGPWLTLLIKAPGVILLPLRAQPGPHALLRRPGTSGFIRNNNNKQRVTLYLPAVFHPGSSKHFTDQDSSVLSPGPRAFPDTQGGREGSAGDKGTENSSFPDCTAAGLEQGSE